MDFDSRDFMENLTYDGYDLGAVIRGDRTVFKLWAPTAENVELNLYESGDSKEPLQILKMLKKDHGVWENEVFCGHGTYYTYTVEVNGSRQEAVDPYAKAGGVNGKRAMVIDLSLTDPDGFDRDQYVKCASYEDAIVWETHVRDFSNRIESSKYRGKYLAFTEHGLANASGQKVGIDYLVDLGITHVQLQPVFDFGSGDETREDGWFNWGYDPANFNFPEGSFSTDPYHGEVRVRELKALVQSLHECNIGVVMDVVYNHTFFIDSNLNKTVPYYYYRYKYWNVPSNGSGCGNETASERKMMRKYMLDSILFWQKEYHIDGFRFDLMALHDTQTMLEIEKAVHEVNPSALIYGEPWAGGDSALEMHRRSHLGNLGYGTGIEAFNDIIRDSIKGSVFNVLDRGYVNGNANFYTASRLCYGMNRPDSVNLVSCHDNFTLWDKLKASCPECNDEKRLAMNLLAAEMVAFSKGVFFMLAGEELLRSKNGDGNSYMSSDEVNNIRWDCLEEGSLSMRARAFYRNLMKLRKTCSLFSCSDISYSIEEDSCLRITYVKDGRVSAVVLVNPYDCEKSFDIPSGRWEVLADGEKFGQEGIGIGKKMVVGPIRAVVLRQIADGEPSHN